MVRKQQITFNGVWKQWKIEGYKTENYHQRLIIAQSLLVFLSLLICLNYPNNNRFKKGKIAEKTKIKYNLASIN